MAAVAATPRGSDAVTAKSANANSLGVLLHQLHRCRSYAVPAVATTLRKSGAVAIESFCCCKSTSVAAPTPEMPLQLNACRCCNSMSVECRCDRVLVLLQLH
ncbi:hypothetical protein Y032_0064g3535 [Ancylostoma ceylanicum]|nr:hypothetical protein Y032_0064g3535 [Ancylostoma ceylanicum]